MRVWLRVFDCGFVGVTSYVDVGWTGGPRRRGPRWRVPPPTRQPAKGMRGKRMYQSSSTVVMTVGGGVTALGGRRLALCSSTSRYVRVVV